MNDITYIKLSVFGIMDKNTKTVRRPHRKWGNEMVDWC